MTYEQAISQLAEIGDKVADKFREDFENAAHPELMSLLKNSNKIHSAASLIRVYFSIKGVKSLTNYAWYTEILQYLMTPEFARDENALEDRLEEYTITRAL